MKLPLRKHAQLACRLPQLYLESRRKPAASPHRTDASDKSVLIISCDPVDVVGSKGDEAMLIALIEKLQTSQDFKRISVFCNMQTLPLSLQPFGIKLERPWSSPWSMRHVLSVIERYDTVVIIGADMLDGYYSLLGAARYWVVANLAARMGKQVVITGFSFNASPPPLLKSFMSPLASSIHICLRDPVSRTRFNQFIGIPQRAQLVADMAFSLQPHGTTDILSTLSTWCRQRRQEGKQLIGFNIHPMLFKKGEAADIEALIAASVEAISAAVKLRPVAIVLIPHDYRPYPKGDEEILRRIHHALSPSARKHCLHVEGHLHAAELKALAGEMDLVVTGRMHLAIASLGMGTPVAGITYQDKFQGLFEHFSLPTDFLAPASALLAERQFEEWLLRAIDAQCALRAQVTQHLKHVKYLSDQNFSTLLT